MNFLNLSNAMKIKTIDKVFIIKMKNTWFNRRVINEDFLEKIDEKDKKNDEV